jgi:hypothetical protein
MDLLLVPEICGYILKTAFLILTTNITIVKARYMHTTCFEQHARSVMWW